MLRASFVGRMIVQDLVPLLVFYACLSDHSKIIKREFELDNDTLHV